MGFISSLQNKRLKIGKMKMELTFNEQLDLRVAIQTRILRISELLETRTFKNDKEYKDERDRMIILRNKLNRS